jgi:hypothetical protein
VTIDYELTVRGDDGEVLTIARGTTDSPEGLVEVANELEQEVEELLEEA